MFMPGVLILFLSFFISSIYPDPSVQWREGSEEEKDKPQAGH